MTTTEPTDTDSPPQPTDPALRYYRTLRKRFDEDPEFRTNFVASLDSNDRHTILHEWRLWARDEQLEPGELDERDADWEVWAIQAGRGYGKTATGANTLRRRIQRGLSERSAIIAPTAPDCRDVCVEGESGVLRWSHPLFKPKYEPSKRRLTWPNGALTFLYSAEEPDRLRGPQHDFVWGDEPSTWKYEEAWTNARLGLRIGTRPQAVLTFTPKRKKWLTDLMEQPTTFLTGGSTYANRANLAASFIAEVERLYEGTRMGRQELHGELLLDVEGALWSPLTLDMGRLPMTTNPDGTLALPPIRDVVCAIDPATSTGGTNGIVIAARDTYGVGYCLDDRSTSGAPAEWGAACWQAAIDWDIDRFVIEDNQGGDMVVTVLEASKPDPILCPLCRGEGEIHDGSKVLWCQKCEGTGYEWTPPTIRVQRAKARTSKANRAFAVSALTDKRRVRMVGEFPALEDQLTSWTPDDHDSPDRLDAFVWAMRSLLIDGRRPVRIVA